MVPLLKSIIVNMEQLIFTRKVQQLVLALFAGMFLIKNSKLKWCNQYMGSQIS